MLKNPGIKTIIPRVSKGFLCPITGEIMADPVMTSDGHTFDRHAIERWFNKGQNANPITHQKLQNLSLTSNRSLKIVIQEYKKQIKKAERKNPQECWIIIPIHQRGRSLKNKFKRVSTQKMINRKPKIQKPLKIFEARKINSTGEYIKVKNPYCEQIVTKQEDQGKVWGNKLEKKWSLSLTQRNQMRTRRFLEQTIQQFQQRWDEFKRETIDWLNDFRNCQTTLSPLKQYQNGYYKGELEEGEHHGYGIMVFKDGNTEYGEWKNGMLHGKAAQYIEKPSRLHAGTFEADALNGLGEIRDTKLNKSIYRGYFQNNLKHGFGIEFDLKNQKTYKGYFVKGKKEGKGREYNYLGEFFEGQWIEDLKHGRGVRVKRDEKFEEFWVKGKKMNGQKRKGLQKKVFCGCNNY